MAEVCRARRLGPSVAVFEPGFLRVVVSAWRAGVLPPGTLVKLYPILLLPAVWRRRPARALVACAAVVAAG